MNPHRLILLAAALLLVGSLGLPLATGQDDPASPTEGGSPEPQPAESAGRKVFIVPVRGLISDVMLKSIKRRVSEAQENGADLIVLEMNTFGGLVKSALAICDYLKNLETDTLAWVNDKAISAGAMISVACNRIVMAPRSRIGDCAPISTGQKLEGVRRAKIETIILEEFRDSANRNGYPLALSEAMVQLGPAVYQLTHKTTGRVAYRKADALEQAGFDVSGSSERETESKQQKKEESPKPFYNPFSGLNAQAQTNQSSDVDRSNNGQTDSSNRRTEITPADWSITEMVNPAQRLLTLGQDDAVEHGFAERIVGDETELAAFTNAADGTVRRIRSTWSEDLANWLASPAVRSVLMIVMMLAGYMELQSPGLGVPGAVAVAALVLMVGAPYLAGLASAMDILLIGAGILLILFELFVLPGFGFAGAAGLVALFGGLLLTFIQSEPGDGWVPQLAATWDDLRDGILAIFAALVVTTVGAYFLTRYFGSIPYLNRLVLTDAQAAQNAPAQQAGTKAAQAAGVPGGSPNHSSSITNQKSDDNPYGVTLGQTGRLVTGCRPVGRAEIDGKMVDVVTPGNWIEPGQSVRITEIHGNRVVVEEA